MFRAQDLGFEYGAPTKDHAEEDDGLYSKEHGNEVHELHRSEDAFSQPGETKKTSSFAS